MRGGKGGGKAGILVISSGHIRLNGSGRDLDIPKWHSFTYLMAPYGRMEGSSGFDCLETGMASSSIAVATAVPY